MPTAINNPNVKARNALTPLREVLHRMQQPTDDNVWKARILGGIGGAGESLLDMAVPETPEMADLFDPSMGVGAVGTTAVKKAVPQAYDAVKGLKGLYSRLTDTLTQRLPSKATPSKIAQIAKSGASPEEMDIRGLTQMLSSRDPQTSISRDEVLQHLEANPLPVLTRNRVPFGSLNYRGADVTKWDKWTPNSPAEWDPDLERLDYREVQLMDPAVDRTQGLAREVALGAEDPNDTRLLNAHAAAESELFKSGHWPQKGTLAHARSRVLPSDMGATKTLFEIQSDHHQTAARRYRKFLEDQLLKGDGWRNIPELEGQAHISIMGLSELPLGALKRAYKSQIDSPITKRLFESQGYRQTPRTELREALEKKYSELSDHRNFDVDVLGPEGYSKKLQEIRNDLNLLVAEENFPPKAGFSPEVTDELLIKQQILEAANDPKVDFFGIGSSEIPTALFPDEGNVAGMQHFYDKEYPDRLRKIMRPFFEQTGQDMESANLASPFRDDAEPSFFRMLADKRVMLGLDPRITKGPWTADNLQIASAIPNSTDSDYYDSYKWIRRKVAEQWEKGMRPPGHEVRGFRMTPEIRKLIQEIGFPAMMALMGLRNMAPVASHETEQ